MHVVDLIRTYYFTFKRDHVIVVLTYVKKKMYSYSYTKMLLIVIYDGYVVT